MAFLNHVNLAKVEEAYARISPHVHQTPVATSRLLDQRASSTAGKDIRLFFKCENLQKTGAFKARGACNAVLKAKAQGVKGVVTHSSGNHGQAVAWAASPDVANLPCVVVVPKETPAVKCKAIEGYGAKLIFCENSPTSRKETCAKVALETGFHIVHPYDDYDIIAGQGTCAYEMLETQGYKDLDAIVTSISGGGLASGLAIAAKALKPDIRIILVEPEGKVLGPCLRSGERLWPNPPQFINTVAEGIKTQQVGLLTFPILCQLAEAEVISVTDDQMMEGVTAVAETMKLVTEASAGAATAALLFKADYILEKWPQIRKVGVILCGGNIDVGKGFGFTNECVNG